MTNQCAKAREIFHTRLNSAAKLIDTSSTNRRKHSVWEICGAASPDSNNVDSATWKAINDYYTEANSDLGGPNPPNPVTLKTLAAHSQKLIDQLSKQISASIGSVITSVQIQCDCYLGQTLEAQPAVALLKCLNTIQSTVKLLAPQAPKSDPPLDAISHQVNFVVAWSASANPTWTLLHFKGPSPTTGTFGSASLSNTHNLTLVMGMPGSAATQNSRSSLTLSSALATQLAP